MTKLLTACPRAHCGGPEITLPFGLMTTCWVVAPCAAPFWRTSLAHIRWKFPSASTPMQVTADVCGLISTSTAWPLLNSASTCLPCPAVFGGAVDRKFVLRVVHESCLQPRPRAVYEAAFGPIQRLLPVFDIQLRRIDLEAVCLVQPSDAVRDGGGGALVLSAELV